jgi:hypothetical protein
LLNDKFSNSLLRHQSNFFFAQFLHATENFLILYCHRHPLCIRSVVRIIYTVNQLSGIFPDC